VSSFVATGDKTRHRKTVDHLSTAKLTTFTGPLNPETALLTESKPSSRRHFAAAWNTAV
jgi:hypothetical protein